jgi:hypothetical protein
MTNNQVICPVCGTLLGNTEIKCNNCNFEDRLGILLNWTNLSDATDWLDTVVIPYKRYWTLYVQQMELNYKAKKLNTGFAMLVERLESRFAEKIGEQNNAIDLLKNQIG